MAHSHIKSEQGLGGTPGHQLWIVYDSKQIIWRALEQSKQTLLKHGPDIVGLKEQSLAIDLIALLVYIYA